eukprot:CAMPEP_0202454350 /NCGR_PEP_ID=MMETSP1360-20130828/12113_1 /ASSEMBLY_ACC=CAM_ASM_000848 /TAXON_ID=515479 /ORGANISM="Licmophora paradoxa, Strain CCMP2313" /LENGTH=403 /DNA_ID=CAMNT_0049073653 /DNA_START=187 /DNA_END=1398 /DNA_ORIENTATION=+
MNTTRNLAIRAAGPQYPALCTQSMVGDGENEIYDVIVLEYNLRADKDLIQLARRLRQRFPKATIIFLHIWLPFQLHHKPSNRNIKAIVENSLDKSKKPAAAYNYSVLLDIVNQTKHYEWEFRDSVSSHLAIQQAAYEVKGYIYDLHRPKSTLQAMLEYGPFFQWDMIHYSEAGHAMIAEEIRKLLARVDAQPSNETRPWKDKDRCMSWFETGEIPRGVEGDGVVMNQFTKHKYGLELQGRSARLGIRNTLNRTLNVYLSYMATGPHKDYPTAEVTIVTNDGENNDSDHHGNMVNDNVQSVIINPLEPTGAYPVHIVQSQLIGQIDVNSLSASIWIRPLQEDRPQPFRVVGIIMTPPYDEHSDYLESEDQTLPSGWSRGEKVVLPHEILEEATTSQNNIHFTDP